MLTCDSLSYIAHAVIYYVRDVTRASIFIVDFLAEFRFFLDRTGSLGNILRLVE